MVHGRMGERQFRWISHDRAAVIAAFKSVTGVADLGVLGLRAAYQALGIVKPQKVVWQRGKASMMAPHVVWAQRLIAYLQRVERSDFADSGAGTEASQRHGAIASPAETTPESPNATVDGET